MNLPSLPASLWLHAVENYRIWLVQQGLSPKTVENYLSDLRRWFTWLNDHPGLLDKDLTNAAEQYLEELSVSNPISTVNRRTAALRRFGDFLAQNTSQSWNLSQKLFGGTGTRPTAWSQWTDRFAVALSQAGCNETELQNLVGDVSLFLSRFPEQDLEQTLTKAEVAKYQAELQNRDVSASDILATRHSLTKFADWATSTGFFLTNPLGTWWTHLTQPTQFGAPAVRPPSTDKLAKLPVWRRWYLAYHRLPFTTALHLAVLVVFASMLSVFAFRQFGRDVSTPFAYPSAPVRPNRQLSFQGRLTDSVGTPITTATNVSFTLHDAVTGGTQLWDSGTCSIDPDQDGIFSTSLGGDCGSEISEDVFSELANVWLEIEVGGETLSPRQPISSVPYALNSETVQGFPVSLGGEINTIPVINALGQVILGASNPSIIASSGAFLIQGESLTFATEAGGDITLQPGVGGTIEAVGDTNVTGALSATGTITFTNLADGLVRSTAGVLSGGATIDLTTDVTGVLPIANGGTNANTVGSAGSIAYSTGTAYAFTAVGSSGECLVSGGTGSPTWSSCAGAVASSIPWEVQNGAANLKNTTLDLLVGGDSTASADFAVLNVNGSGPATASVSGNLIVMPKTGLGGRVGIGITNPNGPLVVSEGISNVMTKIDDNGIYFSRTADGGYLQSVTGNASASLMLNARSNINFLGNGVVGMTLGLVNSNSILKTHVGTSAPSDTSSIFSVMGNAAIGSSYINTSAPTNGLIVEGNTGIGTNAPSYRLDVIGGDARIGSGNTATNLYVADGRAYVGYDGLVAKFGATQNKDVVFIANNIEYARILNTNGNFGIGDTSPASLFTVGSGDLFQVNSSGAIAAATGITSSGTITFTGFSANGGLLYTNGSGVLAQTAVGANGECLVSAGGGAPAWGSCSAAVSGSIPWQVTNGTANLKNTTLDLLVGGDSTASADFAVLNVNGSGPATASVSGNLIVMPKTGLGGNVGIGTTSPGNLLTLASSVYHPALRIGSTLPGYYWDIGRENQVTGDFLFLNANGAGASERMRLTVAGNLGIGTSAANSRLTVQGTAFPVSDTIRTSSATNVMYGISRLVQQTTADAVDGFGSSIHFAFSDSAASNLVLGGVGAVRNGADTEGALVFQTGTNGIEEFMRISSAGNVGIGTAFPTSAKLQLVGSGDLARFYNGSNYGRIYGDGSQQSFINYMGTVQTGVRSLASAGDTGTYSNHPFWIKSNDTIAITVDTSQQVGIGDTSPAALFTVGSGDLFQVNSSGAIAAATGITSSGSIRFSGFSANGGLLYTNGSGVLAQTAVGANGECLVSAGGGAPSWGSCSAAVSGSIPWQVTNGTANLKNTTLDLLVGGDSTASADFAILNVNGSGPATASVSGNLIVMPKLGLGGLVGIGTNNPTNSLQVNIRDGATQAFGIFDDGASGGSFLMRDATNNAATFEPNFRGTSAGSTTRSFIIQGDSVAADSGTTPLTVFRSTVGNTTVTTRPLFQWQNNTSAQMTMLADGKLGIGTTDPSSLLEISGVAPVATIRDTTGAVADEQILGRLSFWNSDTGNPGANANISAVANGGTGGTSLAFYTGTNNAPVERLRIIGSNGSCAGCVGIGTTAPTQMLTVNGSLGFNGSDAQVVHSTSGENLYLASAPDTQSGLRASGHIQMIIDTDNDQTDRYFRIGTNNSTFASATELFRVQEDGFVGIGGDTTPDAMLSVGSTSQFQVNSSGAIAAATGITSSGTITFSGFSANGGLLYTNGSGVLAQTAVGANGECLVSAGGGAPAWGSCSAAVSGSIPWQVTNGTANLKNTTLDLLVGGDSTASADFAVLNVNGSGPATASVSGNLIVMPKTGLGGNVGIGTTSPSYKFQVTTNTVSNQTPLMYLENNFSGISSGISFIPAPDGGGGYMGYSGIVDQDTSGIPSRIDGSVGYRAPGVFGYRAGTNQNNSRFYFMNAPTGSDQTLTELVSILGSGNVGIGTTTPTAKLDVAGSASISGTLAFRGTTDPKIDILNGENLGVRTSLNGDAGLTEKFTILNNGKVGINNTNPGSQLTINVATANDSIPGIIAGGYFANVNGPALKLYNINGGGTPGSRPMLQIFRDGTAGTKTIELDTSGSSSFAFATTAIATNNIRVMDVSAAGTFNTTSSVLTNYGGYFNNTSTRTSGSNNLTNVGLYASASGADVNYAAIFANGNVGIGSTAPGGKLHIRNASSGATADSNANELIIEDSGNSGLNILSGTGNYGTIYFGDSGNASIGRIQYNHADNSLQFWANGSQAQTILSSGNIGIGDTTPAALFTVGTSDAFQVDASGNVTTTGTITASTAETINGIDINAGTVSDVVNLTLNSGGDLTIGSIGLNDVGSSNVTSGASLIGAYDEFDNSSSTTVQDVLDDLDAAITAASSGSFDVAGDSGTPETISPGNTLNIVGGTNGIDTVVSATDLLTINLDTTEIGTTTFGAGSPFTWTFNSGTTDPTIGFDDNEILLTAADLTMVGNLGLTGDFTASGAITFSGLSNGLVRSTSGVLSGGATVALGSEVSGTLPIANGGTNSTATPTAGGIAYGTGTAYAFTAAGSSGDCFKSNGTGAPTWGSCLTGVNDYWSIANGALLANNSTVDFLIGGTATSSADFAVLNVNGSGPATASVSGNLIVMPKTGLGGNVGIGTTAPGQALDVVGKIRFSNSGDAGGVTLREFSGGSALEVRSVSDNAYYPILANTYSAEDGTVNTPGFNFGTTSGDFNTGIRRISADTMSLVTGASDRLTIGSTGNVGIGTNNPYSNLGISGSTTPSIFITNTAWSADMNWGISASGASRRLDFIANQTDSDPTSGGSTIMSLDYLSLGVGIGTTTPTAKLDVSGSASVSGTLSFRGTTDPKINILNGENFGIQTSVGGDAGLSERFTVSNIGYVGIGTTGPSNPLVVMKNSAGGTVGEFRAPNNVASYISITTTDTGAGESNGLTLGYNTQAMIHNRENTDMVLSTNDTTRMIIDAGGNVNIGTNSSPTGLFSVGNTSQFQVNSSGAIAAATGITSSGTITLSGLNVAGGVVYTNGSGVLASVAGSSGQCLVSNGTSAPSWSGCLTSASQYWQLNNTHNVSPANDSFNILVGNTATASADILLRADGGAIFNQNQNDADFSVRGSTVSNLFYVDAGADRVGIRNSSPSRTFDVAGDTRVAGISDLLQMEVRGANGQTANLQEWTSFGGATLASVNSTGLFTSTGLTSSGAAINLNNNSNFAVNIGTGTTTSDVIIGGGSNVVRLDASTLDINAVNGVVFGDGSTYRMSLNFIGNDTYLDLDDDTGTTQLSFVANDTAGGTASIFADNNLDIYADDLDITSPSLSIDSSTWDISDSGVASGFTGITSSGTITLSGLNVAGGVVYTNGSGVLASVAGSSGQCLLSNGTSAPSWSTCLTPANQYWQLSNTHNISPNNLSYNILLGNTASSSANTVLNADGSAVFNEQGLDRDFRIESDGLNDAFFVDGGTNRVGIGIDTPNATVDILSTGLAQLTVSTDDAVGGNVAQLYFSSDRFGTPTGAAIGQYNTSGLKLAGDGDLNSPHMYINTAGDVFIGGTSETLANTGFVMDGNDLYVAGMGGFEGNVYTDGAFVAGASTTYGNGTISQSSGETLTIGTTTATLTLQTTTSGNIVLNSAGTIELQDNTNITGDLSIGSIGLNDVGSSNVTSGASLIGVFDEFANSSSTTVQDVLDDLDAAIAGISVYTGWTLAGDSGSSQTISSADTVSIVGGTNGIDTVTSATDTITLNLDTTEIGSTTFGAGSGFTWTFNAGATDPTIAFASDAMTFTAGTNTFSSAVAVNGNLTIGDASGDSVAINASTWTFANDTNFALTGGTNGLSIDGTTFSVDGANNRVGFGTAAPAATMHSVSTTEQLRLGYDASNYGQFTVQSNGDININAVASSGTPKISLADNVQIATGNVMDGTGDIRFTFGTDLMSVNEELRVTYDPSNYTQFIPSSSGDLTIDPTGGDVVIDGNLATLGDLEIQGNNLIFTSDAEINVSGPLNLVASGVGVGTSNAGRALEINDAAGNNLRLTYNDSDGSAVNFADFLMSSDGSLTIDATGNYLTVNHAAIINGQLDVGGKLFIAGEIESDGSEMFLDTSGMGVGIDTTGGGFGLEINHATGNNLRLTYNDADGSAVNYADLLVSSSGDLTIGPSGGDTNVTGRLTTNGGLTVTGATVNLNASSNFAVNIGTGTSTGTITLGANSGTITQTIDIGTGTGLRTLNLGTQSGSSVTTLQGGAGGTNIYARNGGSLTLNAGPGASVLIGASNNSVSVDSSTWDISTAGVATGFTGITSTNTITGGGVTITNDTGNLTVGRENNITEGGHIVLVGASTFSNWNIDSNSNNLRFFTAGGGTNIVSIFNNAGGAEAHLDVEGYVEARVGSNSAPSFTFEGDGNTGMFQGGADVIGFTTGGTNSVDINNIGVRFKNTANGATCDASTVGTFTYERDNATVGLLYLCREQSGNGTYAWRNIANAEMTSGNPDLAEYAWASDMSLAGGDIVAVTNPSEARSNFYDRFNIIRASQGASKKVLGVVSSDPGIVLNKPQTEHSVLGEESAIDPHLKPLTLAGRVPVKVVTSAPLNQGDRIGLSGDLAGIGSKLTGSGFSVGTVLTTFDPNSASCTNISSASEAAWPNSDKDACYRLPDGRVLAKVLILVNNEYSLADTSLQEDGSFTLGGTTGTALRVVDELGNQTAAISSQGDATFRNTIVQEMYSRFISAESMLVTGDATVEGTLSAQSARFDALNASGASVSGTLYANRLEGIISADSVEGLEARITALVAAQTATLSGAPDPDSDTQGDIDTLSQGSGDGSTITLPGDLIVEGLLQANDGIATNTLLVDTTTLTKDALNFAVEPSCDAETGCNTFAIQPSGEGTITFLNNLVVMSDGSVTINGDLEVTGSVIAEEVQTTTLTTAGENLTINLAGTDSEEGDVLGELIINGATRVQQLTVEAATADADEDDEDQSEELDASSGTAEITSGNESFTIRTSAAKDNSLIYLTATSATDNKVLFIESQEDGEFTVAIDGSHDEDISFNWWVVGR